MFCIMLSIDTVFKTRSLVYVIFFRGCCTIAEIFYVFLRSHKPNEEDFLGVYYYR